MAAQGKIVFNGIYESGSYLIPPIDAAQFGKLAKGEPRDDAHVEDLQNHADAAKANLGVIHGVNAANLAEAGWGVVFAGDPPADILAALKPLLDLRKSQAGSRYHEYSGAFGYKDGPSAKDDFLKRNGAPRYGAVDPARMPYYLLLIGTPAQIPFDFQYQIDVQYAVGRLDFDTAAEYARYARTVVAAETGGLTVPPRAVFFGVANPGDDATQMSATGLVAPLAKQFTQEFTTIAGWEVDWVLPANATKAALTGLLGGGAHAPGFLLTASHGMVYPMTDDRQRERSGALLCQDWPGQGPANDTFYFRAEDVKDDASVAGMIAMFFACYGAGTPLNNEFYRFDGLSAPNRIAESPFTSRLPQRLLGHPRGGALAVFGHIERAFSSGYQDDDGTASLNTYQSAIESILRGETVGMASEYFNTRYSEISVSLTAAIQDAEQNTKNGVPRDLAAFGSLWALDYDARNLVILGDPAVRMPHTGAGQDAMEPEEKIMSVPPSIPPAAQSAPPLPSFATPTAAPASTPRLATYGLISDFGDSLQKVLASIASTVQGLVNDIVVLEVSTYTSGTMDGFENAKLRATSRVDLGGDTKTLIPELDGKVDDALWKIHSDTLDRALTYRAELIRQTIDLLKSIPK